MEPQIQATDESLVAIIAERSCRSEEALAELYRRHAKTLYRSVYRRLPRHEDCEEIVQDVFMRAWLTAHHYDDLKADSTSRHGYSKVLRWLLGMTFYLIRLRWRQWNIRHKSKDGTEIWEPVVSVEVREADRPFVVDHDTRIILEKLNARFSLRRRKIIELRLAGFSNSEIAKPLHLSEKKVENIFSNTVTSIKAMLRKAAKTTSFPVEHPQGMKGGG